MCMIRQKDDEILKYVTNVRSVTLLRLQKTVVMDWVKTGVRR